MRHHPHNGRRRVGFTLVELMVVVVIISIMSAMIVAEMHGTFQDALLRSTSRELASAFSVASSRAVSVNRPHRVRIDRVAHQYVLERSARGGSDFFPVRDIPDSHGKLDPRITVNILQPGVDTSDESGEVPPEDSEDLGGPPPFGLDEAVTFYPDGTADARLIELADRDGFRLAMRINPITSRVQITAIPRQ